MPVVRCFLGLFFWKLADPQLGAYGAEVSQYSSPSIRMSDKSQFNVTEAGSYCAMLILTLLVARNTPLSEVEKVVRHWHAPPGKLLDLLEEDNLPKSLFDGFSYNAQPVANVVEF